MQPFGQAWLFGFVRTPIFDGPLADTNHADYVSNVMQSTDDEQDIANMWRHGPAKLPLCVALNAEC